MCLYFTSSQIYLLKFALWVKEALSFGFLGFWLLGLSLPSLGYLSWSYRAALAAAGLSGLTTPVPGALGDALLGITGDAVVGFS